MKKLAHISIRGMKKPELKKVLKDAGLKNKHFNRGFSDGDISVNYKEINRGDLGKSLSMELFSSNLERASGLYNSILGEGRLRAEEGKSAIHIVSNIHYELSDYIGGNKK